MSPSASAENKSSFLERIMAPVDQWVSNFVTYHTSTEWLVGLAIILIWAVVAFAPVGILAALAAVIFAVALHYIAMETGSHVWLWFSTGVVLLFVIVAYGTALEPLGALILAVGGASSLAYNETVRLNFARRRNAIVDPGVFIGSTLALAVSTVIGVIGIGISLILSGRADRSFSWMPIAVLVLMGVAYAVALIPTVRTSQAKGQRWEPGTRIPPQPIATSNPSIRGQLPGMGQGQGSTGSWPPQPPLG